ncbi:MAG: Holliday junction branch migration DNA helicase RuvB [Planctomycetota bacterium]
MEASSAKGEGREVFRPAPGPAWTDATARQDERDAEGRLRPADFDEFVGQDRIVDNLRVAIRAALARNEAPDHVLLSGPPGLGKTTLARILSRETGGTLHSTSGPALERPRDLVGILTQLRRGDVLFVDEIHRVPATVEEYLYGAMEDFSIDFTLGEGERARVLPMSIEHFTLVGATTREGLLSAPFRARFGLTERLTPYPVEDLVRIVLRSARLLACDLDDAASRSIAERSRGTPRVANRLLRRVRDLAEVTGTAVDDDLVERTMERLGVDENGLEEIDRRLLAYLAAADGRPVGLKTLAAALGETEDTIEEVFEPHLLRKGFVHKTPRGRVITDVGRTACGSATHTALFD